MLTPLIRFSPITNKYEYRTIIKEVLTQPLLCEAGVLFGELINNGEVDLLINELWHSLNEEMKCNPNEVTTVTDLDVDLNEIVYKLVSYCNDPMNFSPRGAPPRMKVDEILMKVAEVLGKD